MNTRPETAEPIYSSLASEPDLLELVETFVDAIPDRLNTLIEAFDAGDSQTMSTCAHQLKGTLGSYGFDGLTEHAARLEKSVSDDDPTEEIADALETFVSICRRITADVPPA